jgi:hypothetical protein
MKQLNLFDTNDRSLQNSHTTDLKMSKSFLISWKKRIFTYQETIREQQENQHLPSQTTVIDLPQRTWTQPDDINPFTLPRHTATFWNLPTYPEDVDDSTTGCLYFIIDHQLPLLLYIGETKLTASKRWQGIHYCKGYMLNYVELHRQYDLEEQVNSAFYYHVPRQKDLLLEWERHLIHKWRSPFNKEMWPYYGQPFKKNGYS